MYRTATGEDYPDKIKVTIGQQEVTLRKVYSLRYGDNPGQSAALFSRKPFFTELKTGKQGIGKINLEDMYRAHRLLSNFEMPACAYMKHLNPSGVAAAHSEDEALSDVVRKARECDSQAAYGATVGVNREIDEEAARELVGTYVECVAAPGVSQEAMSVFAERRDLRVVEFSLLTDSDAVELHLYPEGFATVSAPYKNQIKTKEDLTVVTEKSPTESEYRDLLFSWTVCGHVRSNAIVVARDLRAIGIGTGQQDRVTAARLAVEKAEERGHRDRLAGSSAASDGYLPFRDNVEILAKHGVAAVIQPGGSTRDQDVIAACNELGVAMVFTGARCFSHF